VVDISNLGCGRSIQFKDVVDLPNL